MDGMTYGQRCELPLVLIIDDAKDFTELVAVVLRKAGFRTISAETGEAGINIAEKYRPDAILLDLMLGDRDGREICADLKSRLATADTPILIITGVELEDDLVQSCYESGAHDVIAKPFRRVFVINRLRVAMREQQLREDYKRLATQDPVTGLDNRRQLFLHMTEAVQSSVRHDRDTYLILADIDRLSEINARYGFELGDEVILTMSRLAKRLISPDCRVGRVSGDTIAILLKRGTETQAMATAKRISQTFAAIAFDPDTSPKHFSMSMGVSRVSAGVEHDITPDQLMYQADVALFRQKTRGGRGICTYWNIPTEEIPAEILTKRHSRRTARKPSERSFIQVKTDTPIISGESI